MIEVTGKLNRWFAEHNIPTDGLTLILNFRDAKAAERFDLALNRELASVAMNWGNPNPQWVITTNFKINGIEMKVESPIHQPA